MSKFRESWDPMPEGWDQKDRPITGTAVVFNEQTARYEGKTVEQQQAARDAQQK